MLSLLILDILWDGWASGVTVEVNGEPVETAAHAGWAAIDRLWQRDDVPVNAQHPVRIAPMRGPVAMVLDDADHVVSFSSLGEGAACRMYYDRKPPAGPETKRSL